MVFICAGGSVQVESCLCAAIIIWGRLARSLPLSPSVSTALIIESESLAVGDCMLYLTHTCTARPVGRVWDRVRMLAPALTPADAPVAEIESADSLGLAEGHRFVRFGRAALRDHGPATAIRFLVAPHLRSRAHAWWWFEGPRHGGLLSFCC